MPSSADAVTLVASLVDPLSGDAGELEPMRRVPGLEHASWLEVRADELGEPAAEAFRGSFAGRLLYTLRSEAEGGRYRGSLEERHRRLAAAAQDFDAVDLEAERDLVPEVLEAVPQERRVISWHGAPADVDGLDRRFRRMEEAGAAIYKLIPRADRLGHALAPLELLRRLGRDDVVTFALGPEAAWSRLAALALGSPWIYTAVGDREAAPGQLRMDSLIEDYGLPRRPSPGPLYGIVGNPVASSLSPRIHNGAYRDLGLPGLYVPLQAESFGDLWLELVESERLALVGFHVAGLSVTAPHKGVALAVAGASSPLAQRVGAANTLVRREGVWEAETTDPAGVVVPLEAAGVPLQGASAAVVGCGGAGRAAAVGLELAGANVTLVNRGVERGRETAEQLHLPFLPLEDFHPGAFTVVVQATSLGRGGDSEPLPFEPAAMTAGSAVVDLVYLDVTAPETPLIRAAAEAGLTTVDGLEVLLAQAVEQFHAMTGHPLPLAEARARLGRPPRPGAPPSPSASVPSEPQEPIS